MKNLIIKNSTVPTEIYNESEDSYIDSSINFNGLITMVTNYIRGQYFFCE